MEDTLCLIVARGDASQDGHVTVFTHLIFEAVTHLTWNIVL